MKLSDFDYDLPKNLIAQEPIKPRDHSRLLILDKSKGRIEHKHFYDILDYLQKGDVLVLNNTKVFPARLIGKRKETGGRVEVFLLRRGAPCGCPTSVSEDSVCATKGQGQAQPLRTDCVGVPLAGTQNVSEQTQRGQYRNTEVWQCLVGGHRRKENLEVEFENGLKANILKDNEDGTFLVGFNKKGKALMDVVNKIGQVPLPPYIKRELKEAKDKTNYQTVYADEKKVGSVAAPTAGFHFTPELIKKLKKKGIEFECVTLHVGLGTFAPVKVDDITKHKMHSEWVEVKKEVIEKIIKARSESRRIIAVGTTSVRTLEAVFEKITNNQETITKTIKNPKSKIQNFQGWVNIFIYPGYKFKIVDAMITNFHLPKSTLLMLVSAFAGQEKIKRAYKEAVRKKYRFFSYGDAMFIH